MRALDDQVVRRGRLKRRAEFLHVGGGRRWHGSAMSVQGAARAPDDALADSPPRFGFTLTKRVGNAVVRNRARRRLREAVRLAPADLPARDGHDYVIVGRVDALRAPFDRLSAELARGIAAVHAGGGRSGGGRSGRTSSRSKASRPDLVRTSTETEPNGSPARPAPDRIDPTP